MIPKNIEELFKNIIIEKSGNECTLNNISAVGGGDINQSVMIKTNTGDYFLKYNIAGKYPQMFEKEALGLKLLSDATEIKIPEVIGYDEDQNHTVLVLEYLSSSPKKSNFWENFGKSLARMHNNYGKSFGLDYDNYIGNLHQSNNKHNEWISFFVEERLEKQIAMARNNNRIDVSTIKKFESMYNWLDDFFPAEKPCLLHGDLWSGNYMVSFEGDAAIIDPAVYFGYRLMDLGMSRLFGGFDPSFYEAYREIHNLEINWREATDICNLYPLLVHVNLFGGSYLNSVKSILSKF